MLTTRVDIALFPNLQTLPANVWPKQWGWSYPQWHPQPRIRSGGDSRSDTAWQVSYCTHRNRFFPLRPKTHKSPCTSSLSCTSQEKHLQHLQEQTCQRHYSKTSDKHDNNIVLELVYAQKHIWLATCRPETQTSHNDTQLLVQPGFGTCCIHARHSEWNGSSLGTRLQFCTRPLF